MHSFFRNISLLVSSGLAFTIMSCGGGAVKKPIVLDEKGTIALVSYSLDKCIRPGKWDCTLQNICSFYKSEKTERVENLPYNRKTESCSSTSAAVECI